MFKKKFIHYIEFNLLRDHIQRVMLHVLENGYKQTLTIDMLTCD